MKVLGGITAAVLTVAIQTFIGAFVAITLYRWFLLPIGAPNLTTGQLYGALYFISYVRYKNTDSKDDEDKELGEKLLAGIARSLVIGTLSLGVGWVLHIIIY